MKMQDIAIEDNLKERERETQRTVKERDREDTEREKI